MNRKDFLYSICTPFLSVVGLTALTKVGYGSEIEDGTFPVGSINMDSAARVGQNYIRQGGPELKDVQKSADRIKKKFHFANNKNFKKELQMLNSSIRSDFENGRTVLFHNWVLSQTEIAFCVFAYQNKYSLGQPQT